MELLSLNYTLGSSSIIDNVRKLEPAHYLIYSKNKNIEKILESRKFFLRKKRIQIQRSSLRGI